MHGPQIVKTTLKPHSGPLSPAASLGVLSLFNLIAAGEDPAVLGFQQLEVQQIFMMLLRTAAEFHEGEAPLERIMGALMAGATWIAHHHNAVFEAAQDPRPPAH